MKNIEKLIAELAEIDDDPLTFPAADIRLQNGEVVISGNRAGLQHLALHLLKISNSGVAGAHYHLDECSIANVAETNVIFVFNDSTGACDDALRKS